MRMGTSSLSHTRQEILTPDFYGLGGFDMMPWCSSPLRRGECQQGSNKQDGSSTTESKPNANLVEMPVKPMQKEKRQRSTTPCSSTTMRKRKPAQNSSASEKAGSEIWQLPVSPSSPSSPSLPHWALLPCRRARSTLAC